MNTVPSRVARLVLVGSPGLSAEVLQPPDLQRWDLLPAGAARTSGRGRAAAGCVSAGYAVTAGNRIVTVVP